MTLRALSLPVGEVVADAYRSFVQRVRLRIAQARGTERVELCLGVFGLCNAVWMLGGYGEYTSGWRFAGLVLTQHEAGLVIALINLLRWSSVYEGGIRFRRFVTQVAMYWGVVMLALIWLGNHRNPTLPWLFAAILVGIGVNGALAKYEERGDAP